VEKKKKRRKEEEKEKEKGRGEDKLSRRDRSDRHRNTSDDLRMILSPSPAWI
jgi:hypothetical protein